MPEEYRSRRSGLAVPGSSQRFLDKARGLAADEVFLDFEDAVAPAAKEASRKLALAVAAKGRAAGLRRSQRSEPGPEGSAEHAPRDEGLGQPAGQG